MKKQLICQECNKPIEGKPYAPRWMLGYKFCDKECARKNYDRRILGLSRDIKGIQILKKK